MIVAAAVLGSLVVLFLLSRLLRLASKKSSLIPATECHLGDGFISVVVPAYNEGEGIGLTLGTIDEHAQDKSRIEIIVVDAGSKDNTMEIVNSLKTGVILRSTTSSGGRGPAMNAGASAARGDLFLFLHADTVVPPAFDVTLREAFKDPKVLMTAFRFGVNRALLHGKEPFALGLMERVTNLRTRRLHLPYGDQAFCLTAHKFREVGGFPDFVMMEDYELVRRLRREELAGGGDIRILNQTALCAPRRWEMPGNNVFKNFAKNWIFVFLYSNMGYTPEQIFCLYYGRKPENLAPSTAAASRWEVKGVFKNSLLNFGFVTLYTIFNMSPNQIFRWYYGKEPPVKNASKVALVPGGKSCGGGAIIVDATVVPK